jgi:hypothetical protein
MKTFFLIISFAIALFSCSNKETEVKDNKISLHSDTLNVVKLTDTLVIYESTCRGCKYETSTDFGISDSMNIIKLYDIFTADNNSKDMSGGSISKDLILVPLKTGVTKIKLYKFWTMDKTAKDSAAFTTYNIEVKN